VQGAVAHTSPASFILVRFLIAGTTLALFARGRRFDRGLVRAGVVCGLPLLAGFLLQTIGLRYTTTSVSAFLTYMLVVMVPLMSAVAMRRLPGVPTMIGVAVTVVGLGLLTSPQGGFGLGAVLTLASAFAFALNILLLSREAPRYDPVSLTVVQLFVVAVGAAVPAAASGGFHLSWGVVAAALYTAVVSTALALSLQVWGQRRVGPTRTSLLLMVEPVTAAFIGYAHGEHFGSLGWVGAGLVLAGIALSGLDPRRLTARIRRMKLAGPAEQGRAGAMWEPERAPVGAGRGGDI
jgi:drug/metabolite transporter (DMT)-like permease